MKKTVKSLTFFLLLSSIILPILPTITVAQDDTIVFKYSWSALPDEWDPVVTDWYNIIWGAYGATALEELYTTPPDYHAGVGPVPMEDEWIGLLATDWESEFYPSEMNAAGFNSSGGRKSITFTLRSGVTFHDGSHWNATVAKWNIDRSNLISGNYSGKGQTTADNEAEGNLMNTILVDDWINYVTPSWNISHWDRPTLGTTPPPPGSEPGIYDYAYYDLGPNWTLVDYPGVDNIEPNGTVRNPAPYGGWDYTAGAAIHYAPYDRYPIVKYVEILENPQSGGKIKVHYNHWEVGVGGWVNNPMISYDAYRNNYTVRAIYGFENGVDDPRNAGPVTHMIGTGPYIYVEHDETGTPPGGYMLKNENYWNKTGLESLGLFEVDRYEVINFPAGQLGKDAQNTALLTHALDYAGHTMYMPVDVDAIGDNPNIRFEYTGTTTYKTNIVFNSINETWWAWPWADGWRRGFYPLAGDKPAGGVPRAMRKAMSYAFNYDLMIHTVLDDEAIRGGGLVGRPSIFYNDTLATTDYLAYYNVTKAREILLTTESDPLFWNTSTPVPHTTNPLYTAGYPYGDHNAISLNPENYNFSKMVAERGLTASSTDAEWQNIADTNPIYTLNFYWDSAHEDVKNVLLSSLRNIGCTLRDKTGVTNRVTTIIWDTVRIGHLATFDGEYGLFSCNAWVMDEDLSHSNPELNLFWAHSDPDKGRWRPYGAGGISSWHYWGNFGFNFDSYSDAMIDRMWATDKNTRKQYINELGRRVQTVIYPKIWAYEAKVGWALWKDWEVWTKENRDGQPNIMFSTNFVTFPAVYKYVGLPTEYQIIPGAPLLITLTLSAVSMIGIIYTIMRKNRLT